MSIRFNALTTTGTALALALLAGGCAMDEGQGAAQETKVAEPSTEIFDYAPEGADESAKGVPEMGLNAKGTWSNAVPRGYSFEEPITLAPNESITCTTSEGSVGVDTVLALLRRHDNANVGPHSPPYDARVGFQTLAVNDDFGGTRYSEISYTNQSGRTEYAFLEGFAWSSSTGTARVVCTNRDFGTRDFVAGSLYTSCDQGAVDTSSDGDPVLLMIDTTAGLGNGVWNDDSSGRESKITGATNLTMWFVAQGYNSGTTTINCRP